MKQHIYIYGHANNENNDTRTEYTATNNNTPFQHGNGADEWKLELKLELTEIIPFINAIRQLEKQPYIKTLKKLQKELE